MNLGEIAALDLVLGTALAWALIAGFRKGLIVKIASLIALILGIYAGFHGSNLAAQWLSEQFDWGQNSLQIGAFVLTFIAVVIGVHFLAKLIEKIVDLTALGWLNKLGGMCLGVFQMVMLISATMFALDGIFGHREWLPKDQVDRSVLYNPVESAVEYVVPEMNRNAPWQEIQDRIETGIDGLQEAVQSFN